MDGDGKDRRNDGNKGVQDDYWKKKQKLERKGVRLFTQTVFYDWCKACGICIAFCPKEVYSPNQEGKPIINQADACIGCLFCELHCPDFAITITDRYPDRRKKQDGA